MPDPTRIRAIRADDSTTVKILMSHAMETGLRADAEGNPVAAWFIKTVTVSLNGKPIVKAEWGPAVSRNPYLQVQLRGVAAGDRIGVAWLDTRGATRSDEVTVT